jgi:hypothetical protein
VNAAWSRFVTNRCILLNLYNRHYSTMCPTAENNPGAPGEPPIDPASVGCAP